ncbi:hypothetical protein KPSA3_01101 [Pseudomonas syringae pv. actinidiae]|uniref:Uncharacterized protein n=1 Tax=Pseudomonas syringae pv. actinidiae TaxID=103796 RepID=A0AAN4TJ13_PSESF|nr:hypothetical protein KPSA3_01101 [Pseudomonas syringae pv. actinidiae]
MPFSAATGACDAANVGEYATINAVAISDLARGSNFMIDLFFF